MTRVFPGMMPVVLAIVVLGHAPAADAELVEPRLSQPSERHETEATRMYDKAAKLAQQRNFAAALSAARESMTLAPSAQRAALLGAIQVELGRDREAFEALLIALNLDADHRLEDYILRRVAALRPLVPMDLGIVRFQIDPAAAECELVATGERFELSPGRVALGVPAGRHTIRCSASGALEGEADVEVPARRGVTVSMRLVPAADTSPLPDPGAPDGAGVDSPGLVVTSAPAPASPPGSNTTLATALVIGGGVLLATGAGFHIWGLEAVDRANDALTRARIEYDSARADYDDATASLELRRGLAIGGYVAGGLAVGAGIILLLGDDDSSVSVVPSLQPNSAGAACALSF